MQQIENLTFFGCPVFVLDPSLQSMKKIDKWQQTSRVGAYSGQSMIRSTTVRLVLSIKSG